MWGQPRYRASNVSLPLVIVTSIHRPWQFQICNLQMPLELDYDEITAKFDRLVADGIVFYKPSILVPDTHRGMIVRPSPP